MFNHKSSKSKLFFIGLSVLVSVLGLCVFVPKIAKAYHSYYVNNPAVSDSEEADAADACPASASASNQTIGNLYFNPSEITTAGGVGTTNTYAFAFMCSNSNYSTVSSISINIVSTARWAGSGNVSFSPSTNFPLPNIASGDYDHATNPTVRTASLTSLSQGNNCWTITYDLSASYGGAGVDTGRGTRNLCVFYNPATNAGDCDILSATPKTLVAGQSFVGTFGTSNMGGTDWLVGGIPKTSSNANRYTLRTSSPNNNVTWGVSRVELPGNAFFGTQPIFLHGWYIGPFSYNFTAPTTPGSYLFSWRVSQEGVPANDNIGGCSKTITVTAAPASLDGVKIDDSGVSSTGSSTPPWGGYCNASVAGMGPNCGNGTAEFYPFSNDCVQIDDGACMNANSFSATGISPGTHTISISSSGNGSWTYRGYSICEDGAACTSKWLTTTTSPGNNITSGVARFPYTFGAGKRYHMRWIFSPPSSSPTVNCSRTSSPTAARNEPVIFLASGGSSGAFTWSYPGGTLISTSGLSSQNLSVSYAANGTYYVTATRNGISSPPPPSSCTVTITDPPVRPYFRVYGGDIIAGSSFPVGTNCPAPQANSGILAFNKGAPEGIGAGTQLAAMAVDMIYGFSSADMRSGGVFPSPTPLIGLTFANKAGIGDSTYRGSFGYAPCMTDYSQPLSTGTGYSETNPGAPYTQPSMSPALGSRQVIRVSGDIYITGDIIYTNSGTSWASIADIPSLYIIAVGGDIYIDNGVKQLDGVYVAQPSGLTGGTIYTCTDNGAFWLVADLADKCDNQQLTVNGAFIAKTVKLMRLVGNLDSAAAVANEPSSSVNIAEIFNYTPELFLVPSPFTTNAPYQSITNLPPVL